MTNTTLHLIGCASGVGGADTHSGDGPLVLQKSSFLENLVEQGHIHWEKMLHPEHKSSIGKEKAVAVLSAELANNVSNLAKRKKRICIVGGDHSCGIGTWSGIYDAYHDKGDIGLIWIDAHMDGHTPETTPSGNIHGMPVACLLGYGSPTLTGILHQAAKIKAENLCLIGVRSYEAGEAALLKRLGVKIYYMEDVKKLGMDEVMRSAVLHVSKHTVGYGISLDLDSIDPKEAPGVDVPEPNGIHYQDLLQALTPVFSDPRLLATEIVEFDPTRDKNKMTEIIATELLAVMARCHEAVRN